VKVRPSRVLTTPRAGAAVAWPLRVRANEMVSDHQLSGRGIVVWIRSFIEPDLFDNNVPFTLQILSICSGN